MCKTNLQLAKEAKKRGEKFYKRAFPCKKCGCEYNYSSSVSCVECQKNFAKDWIKRNYGKYRRNITRWTRENSAHVKKLQRDRNQYRYYNDDEYRERCNVNSRRWYWENKAKKNG